MSAARKKRWRARGGFRPGRPGSRNGGRGGRPRGDAEPTPELQARRIALAGGEARVVRGKLVVERAPDGDPAKTATPLDVLETRRLISVAQAAAGRQLAADHALAFPTGGRGDGVPPSIPALERAEAAYAAGLAALEVCGERVKRAVLDAAVWRVTPRCLVVDDTAAGLDLWRLREGLNALERVPRSRLKPTGMVRRARQGEGAPVLRSPKGEGA